MIDFDCAAPYNPDRLPSKRVGTDGYFAPEIDGTYKHHNRRRYDTKVDIWSAGITFAKYAPRMCACVCLCVTGWPAGQD